MNDSSIQAEVMQLPITSLELCFAVEIKFPVEMPPRIYKISLQEVMARARAPEESKIVMLEMLTQQVLFDYNQRIEDFPLLDMFEDCIKYKTCSKIEFSFSNPTYLND